MLSPLDSGQGIDTAALLAHLAVADSGIGVDIADLLVHLSCTETSLGVESASWLLKFYASGNDEAVASESAAILAHLAATDQAIGTETAALLAHLAGSSDVGSGGESGSAAFTAHAPATVPYSATGSNAHSIAAWCRYMDVVLAGGGNGGGGGFAGFVTGGGGNAGNWSHVTVERGVDIPWSASTLTIVIPTATAGGTQGNKGAGGGTVTAAVTGTSWAGLSATGGTGDQFGTTRNGQSPGTHTYNGQSYNGGAVQTTSQGAGNPPGGGGNGGTGNAFNGNTGGAGALGGGWVRSYQ